MAPARQDARITRRSAGEGADERELEITAEDVGVEARSAGRRTRNHTRELLLNPVAICGVDEQIVAQPSQRMGGTPSPSRDLSALGAGVSSYVRARAIHSSDGMPSSVARSASSTAASNASGVCRRSSARASASSRQPKTPVRSAPRHRGLGAPRQMAHRWLTARTRRHARRQQYQYGKLDAGSNRYSWRHAVFRPFRHRIGHFGRPVCSLLGD